MGLLAHRIDGPVRLSQRGRAVFANVKSISARDV